MFLLKSNEKSEMVLSKLLNYIIIFLNLHCFIFFWHLFLFFSHDISKANLSLTLVQLTFPPPWEVEIF